ncbi:ABC transporter substrate-binding protein [Gemmobacter sp.]|uniref:ABC transporter substrate-binding protein n=1 Tax=Gemmobacter sp. TaxID=1898957 RepID=UPI002AFEBA67|nr:ABC transporter substrate-binding protein [Gemmobacter sp.]
MRHSLISAVAATVLALPAHAETRVRLGLDWGYLPYHAPIALGVDKGYFKDEGIDLFMEPGRGSASTAIMLGEGNYDIAHINTSNAAVAISKGVPIRTVAVYQTRTAASFIGIKGKVKLDSVEAIKGYRIGSTPGGSDQLSLRIFRAVNKLGEMDLDVVSLDANAKQAGLMSGNVQVISGDGFAYGAIIRGTGQEAEIFSLADAGVPLMGFGYSVNTKFLESSPETITAFLRAVKRSWQDAVADPDGTCEKGRAKLELTHKQDACVDYLKGLMAISDDPALAGWGARTEAEWSALISTLAEVGEIQSPGDLATYYTNALLPN